MGIEEREKRVQIGTQERYRIFNLKIKSAWGERSSSLPSKQITPAKTYLSRKSSVVEREYQGSGLPCTFLRCRFKLSFLPTPSLEYLHPIFGQKNCSGGRTPAWCARTCLLMSFVSAKRILHVGERHAMRLSWVFWCRLKQWLTRELESKLCQLTSGMKG